MAATGSGSYVLQAQPQTATTSNASTTGTSGTQVIPATIPGGASLAVRTLQGIKVIPVQTAQQRPGTTAVLTSQPQVSSGATVSSQQLVARIISNRPGGQPAQIVLPNSSFGVHQPVLVAQAQQQATQSQPTSLLQQAPQIAISMQPHKVAQPQVTTVTLPIQSQQKR